MITTTTNGNNTKESSLLTTVLESMLGREDISTSMIAPSQDYFGMQMGICIWHDMTWHGTTWYTCDQWRVLLQWTIILEAWQCSGVMVQNVVIGILALLSLPSLFDAIKVWCVSIVRCGWPKFDGTTQHACIQRPTTSKKHRFCRYHWRSARAGLYFPSFTHAIRE